MALPGSGVISISDIWDEFGAPDGTPLTDFYRGGAWVPEDELGGVNSGVPASGAITIPTDFYGASRIPNPYQIKNYNFRQRLAGNRTVLILGPENLGLAAAHDEPFVIDLKFNLAPLNVNGQGPIGGLSSYTNETAVAAFWIGLTHQDPATTSQNLMYEDFSGCQTTWYTADEDHGFMITVMVSNPAGNSGFGGQFVVEDSAPSTDYDDNVKPKQSQDTRIRVQRNSTTVGGRQNWTITMYEDDFSTVWNTRTLTSSTINTFNGDRAGWPAIAVLARSGGFADTTIADVRVFVGSDTPPWTWP